MTLLLVLVLSGLGLFSIHQRTAQEQKTTCTIEDILCQTENRTLICCSNSSGAGWTVIQQRFNGSVEFNRSWVEYRDGFGEVASDKEFWWGLERVHQLTKTGKYELLIEMKDAEDEFRFARYSELVVEGEDQKYKLSRLGSYSGTAGDSLEYQKGQKFSTQDNDNDNNYSSNCAKHFEGAWWFDKCYFSHLNGPYDGGKRKQGIHWVSWKNNLKYSRMMIRLIKS